MLARHRSTSLNRITRPTPNEPALQAALSGQKAHLWHTASRRETGNTLQSTASRRDAGSALDNRLDRVTSAAGAVAPLDRSHRSALKPSVSGAAQALCRRLNVAARPAAADRHKKNCDHGQCGAATVHVNQRRVNACITRTGMHDGDQITSGGLRQHHSTRAYRAWSAGPHLLALSRCRSRTRRAAAHAGPIWRRRRADPENAPTLSEVRPGLARPSRSWLSSASAGSQRLTGKPAEVTAA